MKPAFLFFKATIADGAAGDLFAQPVEVEGYTTKHGTFVAPYHSTRKKKPERPAEPDLFSAPPVEKPSDQPTERPTEQPTEPTVAPNKPEPAAKPASPPAVPDSVLLRLRTALEALRHTAEEMQRAREKLDAPGTVAAGGGRYEADVIHNHARADDAARAALAKFREAAARLGVDADKVIADLGGEPDLTPSPEAAAWLEGGKAEKPAAEPAEPDKTAGASPDETRPNATEPEPAAEAGPDRPADWGVAPGTGKAERRRLNAAAVALLDSKGDAEMTAADRQTLARYTGRGGCGDSLNEFYTDPAVASAMWSMLANAGFRGGEVLEPSAGTGVFLHTAPAGARVTAVEIDPTSSRIARILHAGFGHEVAGSSLERFATQDGRQFDAVIGNVPFGVRGAVIKDDKPDLSTAEQYFLDTALDKAKDGGLVALIVPTGIMDSANARAFRERIMRKAEFLGAHRLPNTAFEASHTAVTSDIVIFRKRPQDAAGALSTLTQDQLQKLGVWDPELLAGAYFIEGPGREHVLGRLEEGWRAKAGIGQDITVTGSMAGVPEALAQWHPDSEHAPASPSVQQVLDSLGDDLAAKKAAVNAAMQTPYQLPKLGDTRVIDGVLYVLQGEPPRWHRAQDAIPEAVGDAHHIAEMLDDLAEGRARDPSFTRMALQEALDQYVKLHGVPSRNKALLRWLAAPSMPPSDELTAAEHARHVEDTRHRVARLLGAVRDDGGYSDLVTGRSEQADATLDTVATKLALESGGFTLDQLVDAWGKGDRDSVLDHLYASPDYALESDGRTWTTLDAFLSGELWPKLDAMREMAAHEGVLPEAKAKYERQAAALEEAIQPQSLDDVEILVNSGFVTPEVLTAWRRSIYDAKLAEYPQSRSWMHPAVISYRNAIWSVKSETGGRLYGDDDLLEKVLNRTGVKKDDQAAVERLNREFREWLLGSPYRDQVEEAYNRSYRGFRQKAYSDAPIAVPGLNPVLSVNAYHFAGLRWALEAGKGIIAADVGLGKTGRGLMLARLAKVTGQAKRPTFVVPKSVLANWMAEAEFWFPGSKVLVIGETYSRDKGGRLISKPDNEETRRKKYHDLQQNEYDFVFVSMPAWNDLDLDPITKGEYLEQDFWVQRGDALGNAGDKRTNKIREAYNQAKAKREFAKREGTIYFNDLGIDLLILDEGQAYKNLYSAKNRFGESPKFLGGSGESNRAQDTFYKTKNLRENNGGKGVFMLTATPTKNSPLEVYSMLSHIAPEAFERMGIRNSEEFLDRFCDFRMDTILGVNGELKEALVTAGFKNMDELREVMRRYIDRKTAEDVGLVIPRADSREHTVDMTSEQEAVYQKLRKDAEKAGKGDATGDSHIFSIMDKMQKAAVDLGLLGAQHVGAHSPKIAALVGEVVKGLNDGKQVVFCDSVPTHERIVAELVKAGVPRDKIAILNADAVPTSAARQRISDDFNSGKLTVVVGNTATMGEGVNLQKGTSDIHHLDLPWEPASVQQRNGRGRRQGNKAESIRIHSYLAKGSFDGYRWQTVSAKKDWMDLLWNGGDRVENLARAAAPGRQEMLIMLSANPEAAREKYQSDRAAAEQRKLAEQRSSAANQFHRLQKMRTSLDKLQADGSGETAAAVRLQRKIALAESALHDNQYFPHKDAIDAKVPALFEPVSGHLWSVGTAFSVTPGKGSPIEDAEPSKWVVTGVDVPERTVQARRYGSSSVYGMTLGLDKMQQNVTPADYSADAEAAEIKATAERLKHEAGAKRAEMLKRSGDVAKLKGMDPDLLAKVAPEVQSGIKAAMRDYQDGHHAYYGLVAPDGTPIAVTAHKAREMIGDHDVILPTAEGRQRAIEGYVNAALRRTIETHYGQAGRGRHARQEARGIKPSYPAGPDKYDRSSTNPWSHVMKDVFPGDVEREAKAEVQRRVLANVEAAPDFRAAMVAAQPAVDVQEWVPHRASAWPKPVARALRAKAEASGVLDKRLRDTLPPDPGSYSAPVHIGMLELPKRRPSIDKTSQDSKVRDFLDLLDEPDVPQEDDDAEEAE